MYYSDELPDYFDADSIAVGKRLDERRDLKYAASQAICDAPTAGNSCGTDSLFAANQSNSIY
jgi:hypothetical protein